MKENYTVEITYRKKDYLVVTGWSVLAWKTYRGINQGDQPRRMTDEWREYRILSPAKHNEEKKKELLRWSETLKDEESAVVTETTRIYTVGVLAENPSEAFHDALYKVRKGNLTPKENEGVYVKESLMEKLHAGRLSDTAQKRIERTVAADRRIPEKDVVEMAMQREANLLLAIKENRLALPFSLRIAFPSEREAARAERDLKYAFPEAVTVYEDRLNLEADFAPRDNVEMQDIKGWLDEHSSWLMYVQEQPERPRLVRILTEDDSEVVGYLTRKDVPLTEAQRDMEAYTYVEKETEEGPGYLIHPKNQEKSEFFPDYEPSQDHQLILSPKGWNEYEIDQSVKQIEPWDPKGYRLTVLALREGLRADLRLYKDGQFINTSPMASNDLISKNYDDRLLTGTERKDREKMLIFNHFLSREMQQWQVNTLSDDDSEEEDKDKCLGQGIKTMKR